jgi:hypothetical protein
MRLSDGSRVWVVKWAGLLCQDPGYWAGNPYRSEREGFGAIRGRAEGDFLPNEPNSMLFFLGFLKK